MLRACLFLFVLFLFAPEARAWSLSCNSNEYYFNNGCSIAQAYAQCLQARDARIAELAGTGNEDSRTASCSHDVGLNFECAAVNKLGYARRCTSEAYPNLSSYFNYWSGEFNFNTDKNLGCPTEVEGAIPDACGNPVAASTGNKFQIESDLSSPDLLDFVRYYNSSYYAGTHLLGTQ